jgi:hypothetical protein
VSRSSTDRSNDASESDRSTAVATAAWSSGSRFLSIQFVQQRQTMGVLSGTEEVSWPLLSARRDEPPFCSQADSTLASWPLCTFVVVLEGVCVLLPPQPASANTTSMAPSDRVRAPSERIADAAAAGDEAQFTGGPLSSERNGLESVDLARQCPTLGLT